VNRTPRACFLLNIETTLDGGIFNYLYFDFLLFCDIFLFPNCF